MIPFWGTKLGLLISTGCSLEWPSDVHRIESGDHRYHQLSTPQFATENTLFAIRLLHNAPLLLYTESNDQQFIPTPPSRRPLHPTLQFQFAPFWLPCSPISEGCPRVRTFYSSLTCAMSPRASASPLARKENASCPSVRTRTRMVDPRVDLEDRNGSNLLFPRICQATMMGM